MIHLTSIRTMTFVCLGAYLLVLGTGYAEGQTLVSAKVLSIEGQVEIRRPSHDQPQMQKIVFEVADELRAGDTILTGRTGRLVLGLSDGSQAVIAPQTTVVIKDLSQSPRTLFEVLSGKTRVHIEKLGGQPNPYRVNTPTAVIAVRGTTFDVLVEDDETQVFLHEGEVVVFNQLLPDRPISLTGGWMTRIRFLRLPTNPGTFKPEPIDGFFKVRRIENWPQDMPRAGGIPRLESNRGGPPGNGPRSNKVPGGGGRRP